MPGPSRTHHCALPESARPPNRHARAGHVRSAGGFWGGGSCASEGDQAGDQPNCGWRRLGDGPVDPVTSGRGSGRGCSIASVIPSRRLLRGGANP